MAIFKYQGYKNNGSEIQGTIEADGQRDAIIKIKATGIFPREITEAALFKKKIFQWKKLPSNLPEITRSLSTMLSSGVPLIEAVGAAAAEQKGQWKGILIDIKDRLLAGSTFARATQAYPDIFPDFFSGIVTTGENSGTSLKNKVQTALIYPLFMGFVSILILSFLFTFVVPKITKIFEETAATLPFITVLLIWVSTVFHKFWWLLALMAVAAVVFFQWLKNKKKEVLDAVLLKLPFGAFKSLYLARFSMTMSFLLSGGVSIINALNLTARVTGNAVLEKKVHEAQNLVSQGARLSTSLEGLPPTFLQILSTGEKSGQLAEVLEKAAVTYESDFDKKLQRVIRLMEPVLILFMGLIVGFIVIAVLLPIFELNQLIR
jgi:general secretion pathway protein F